MDIKLHTRDVHLGKEREKKVLDKFEKLGRFADRIGDESSEIRLELAHEESKKKEETFLCVLTLFVPHDTLRVESRSRTLETAIDEVLEKIKGPIARYKEKTEHLSTKK